MLKVHAFVRENAPKILSHKKVPKGNETRFTGLEISFLVVSCGGIQYMLMFFSSERFNTT